MLSAIGYMGLGLPLNALLLWLIPRCTEDEMRTYSRILTQLALTDSTYIVLSAITQYVCNVYALWKGCTVTVLVFKFVTPSVLKYTIAILGRVL